MALAERGAGRVECQTLFCTAPSADARFERKGFASRARHYMRRELVDPVPEPAPLPPGVALRALKREDLAAAAEIIYQSHQGSVDAALNMTYATPATCRAFVETLVVRSGCGQFDAEASRFACGPRGPLGVLIASRLSRANGHVCQVSVTPGAQQSGLGAALVCRALLAFRSEGLASPTLSRQVLYLGEINDSQHAAWCRAIDVLHEGSDTPEPLALFPDDRPVPALRWATVQIRLSELSLHRPRQWGARWLALRALGAARAR